MKSARLNNQVAKNCGTMRDSGTVWNQLGCLQNAGGLPWLTMKIDHQLDHQKGSNLSSPWCLPVHACQVGTQVFSQGCGIDPLIIPGEGFRGSAWVPSKYPKVTQLGGFNQVFSNVYLTKSGDLPWSPHGCPIFSSFNSALGLTCFGLAQMMMQLVHHARCFPRETTKNSFLDGATIQVIGSREHPENLHRNPPTVVALLWWFPL